PVRAGEAHHLGRAERLLVVVDRAGRVADDEIGGDAGVAGGNWLDHEKSPRVFNVVPANAGTGLLPATSTRPCATVPPRCPRSPNPCGQDLRQSVQTPSSPGAARFRGRGVSGA